MRYTLIPWYVGTTKAFDVIDVGKVGIDASVGPVGAKNSCGFLMVIFKLSMAA